MAESLAPPVPSKDEEDEEALEMGLTPGPGKRKSNGGSGAGAAKKPKKTKEDLKNEAMAGIRKELGDLISSLQACPNAPTGQNIGRLDRMMQNKVKEFRSCNDFAGLDDMKVLHGRLERLRAASKLASAMMVSSRGSPKKAQTHNDFIATFRKLRAEDKEMFDSFPKLVRMTFLEGLIPVCSTEDNWPDLEELLGHESFFGSMRDPESRLTEEEALNIIETLIGAVLTKFEKTEIESRSEKATAAAKHLSAGLTAVSVGLTPLTDTLKKLALMCGSCGADGEGLEAADLQKALDSISDGEKVAPYRALFHSDLGTEIFDMSSGVSLRLQVRKDALNHAALRVEVFEKFAQMSTAAELQEGMGNFQTHCTKFQHAVQPPFSQDIMYRATEAFGKALLAAVPVVITEVFECMKSAVQQLRGDVVLELEEPGWGAKASPAVPLLQEFIDGEGAISKMVKMLARHKLLDATVHDVLRNAQTALELVPGWLSR